MSADNAQKVRVLAFVDGFNLYHALVPRYEKYKWLCLTSLAKRFIASITEELVGVEYFTTLPTWDDAKRLRHETFISAQKTRGVRVTKGEFKHKTVTCRASCKQQFKINVEKQTDVNIAVAMIDRVSEYDKLLLLTADSDQVPAIKLLLKLHPEKKIAVIVPIGRKAKELKEACGSAYKITEDHLRECQLPDPLPIMRDGKQVSVLIRPTTWPR